MLRHKERNTEWDKEINEDGIVQYGLGTVCVWMVKWDRRMYSITI